MSHQLKQCKAPPQGLWRRCKPPRILPLERPNKSQGLLREGPEESGSQNRELSEKGTISD